MNSVYVYLEEKWKFIKQKMALVVHACWNDDIETVGKKSNKKKEPCIAWQ